jgi:peptide-methionine (S)-S-oxide reductase
MENAIAVFGGGCFWCTEAVFKMIDGVVSVMPGYAGGTVADPSYEEVCGGTTGHAEAIRIEYDPSKVKYEDLLTVFFATHDPTTLNRQGNDVGTQYRSIVLTTDEEQKTAAEAYVKGLDESSPGGKPIVTEIKPLEKFYEAEDYHRDYFAKNPDKPYCALVVSPKVKKAKERFAELLKKNAS